MNKRMAFPFEVPRQRWLAAVGLGLAFGIAYFAAAHFGLALRTKPEGIAIFWPAAGIAIGALIALGPTTRLPIAVGVVCATALSNALVGRNIWVAVIFGLVNAAQTLLTAWLIERNFGRLFKLEDVPHVLGFLVASAIGAALAAVGAATAVSLVAPATSPLNVWRLWFAACSLGIVTVAPVLIGLGQALREPPTRGELIEGAAGVATLAVMSVILIALPQGAWTTALPVALVFPLLLWIVVRCRPVFAAAAAFVMTLAVLWSTTFGMGHFGDARVPLADRILAAQTLVLVGVLLVLILTALFAERRRSETVLKQSKEHLQQALDGASLGAFSINLATGDLECDVRAAQIHGHKVPPLTSKEVRRFVHPDDRSRIDAGLAEVGRTGGTWQAEYRVVHQPSHASAAETRWVALDGSIVRNARGAPVSLRGTVRDITQRKKADQQLAERNLQLALAGKAALVGSYAYDVRTDQMEVSEGYAVIHGLPEGTTKTARREWQVRVHPEDVGKLDNLRRIAFECRRGEYNADYRTVLPGRGVRWIEARSFISYNGDGQPERVIGVNIDVTERKHTEALLSESNALLVDAMAAGQVMAFEWDVATRVSKRCDRAVEILGYQPQSGSGAQHDDFLSRVHREDRDGVKTNIRKLCPGQPSYAMNFRFIRPDGRQVWLEETAKGEFDTAGGLLRIKGLTRDITERKALEEQKNLLIAELDHRVKNVLAIVAVVASRTQETNSSMADFVAALEGRIQSMAATHELLSHRRWQGIPLAQLVQRELAPYATDTNTRIDGADDILSADAGQAVAMVIHELATNAAKFGALSTATGNVYVRWSQGQNGQSRGRLCIEWVESGGPEVLPNIRSGYGTSVIRDLIPYELGGTVDLVLAPEGVRCEIKIPIHWLSAGEPPGHAATDLRPSDHRASGYHVNLS
jgi:PAS domain S-box-containing protein